MTWKRVLNAFGVLKHNSKTIFQIAFGLLSIALAVYFLKHESVELLQVQSALANAKLDWIGFGIFLVLVYILVQGLMYKLSFSALGSQVHLSTSIGLFLKRNLVSVFLPAGMLTNMFFFNNEVEKKEGVSRAQIYFASSIFSICSILTGILFIIPGILWLFLKDGLTGGILLGLSLLGLLLVAFISVVVFFLRKKAEKNWLLEKFPKLRTFLEDIRLQSIDRVEVAKVVMLSILVEAIGIAHLYIAVAALGGSATLESALIGYSIVLLLLMISPFLRGIGAIEAALTYALTLFGLSTVIAVSATFLFRFFEFWVVLLAGVFSLIVRRDGIVLRILPALLLFSLGVVNTVSVITPAILGRFELLEQVIPADAIHASSWFVLSAGLALLAISVYLIRGLKSAWIAAVVLSALSLVAHLTKGIDWEEATLAMLTLGSLLYQRKHYFIRTDYGLIKRSFRAGIATLAASVLFGVIGFYFLDTKHFGTEFSFGTSLKATFYSLAMLNGTMIPLSSFGRSFLVALNLLGGFSAAIISLSLLKPLIIKSVNNREENIQKATALVQKYGKSTLDYFKLYRDKKFWFPQHGEGFISYKTTSAYAVVLGNPVCADDRSLKSMIQEFDSFCRLSGLRSAYYRIPEASVSIYESSGKNTIPIGEDAVVNLETWTMKGSERGSLRNAVNKIAKLGLEFKVNPPPQGDDFLQKLRAVSDAWLIDMERSELVFSQGSFEEGEIKNHVVLSLENSESKVVGFINLIPSYVLEEANFDLMRKATDAPNGTMDSLFAHMLDHLKGAGYKRLSLGMVPLSGIGKPENVQERLIKTAYEHIRKFSHYRSLHSFKEKFDPQWEMKYMAYEVPFDMIYLPGVLDQVFTDKDQV